MLAVLAGGCGSSTRAVNTISLPPRPSTPATLQILFPAPNSQVSRNVAVTMRLANAHLVPPTQVGGAILPDRGHIHLLLDGQLIAMPLQLSARLPRLSAGMHTVEAEFVASDHLAFANRVVAAVTFHVR